ncbi:MAG: phenazine-specific anthranilate synthase component I [Proteobacteria bacterium]|jgi:phenazine biosynthesis protein phzE|nr:anthranilate synthase family protein [Alphaproteobacteria bacterium]NCC03941.1 phenazine-specific anthranilate synthase component I [Pseudomonadota bacterium]
MSVSFSAEKPFAFIRFGEEERILHVTGIFAAYDRLADIPRQSGKPTNGKDTYDTLSVIPYCQVKELGFQTHDAGEKILTIQIETQDFIPLEPFLSSLPRETLSMAQAGIFMPGDDDYAKMVQNIIDDEIGNGEGCNFVVPRSYKGTIDAFSCDKALSVFRRLLENEYGAYWTFLIFTGDRYFIGATPERHLCFRKGQVLMQPISGTFRKMEHAQDKAEAGLLEFLGDQKEIFELLMVVDEELKMMAGLCSSGGQVIGPMLKEMSKLIHTEYVLVGYSKRDIIDMLRESMFAATVVGSPIENAARINYRHNPLSRGYYGSALALIGRDEDGEDVLDSPITIRMADIKANGELDISVGTTIVKDSDPISETAETVAKARGMMAALGINTKAGGEPTYRLREKVYGLDMMIKLSSRNAHLSRFWIEDQTGARFPDPKLMGKTVTIIDNEDAFTRMLSHMIASLGLKPRIVKNADYDPVTDSADLIVLGPGPGDPRDRSDARIAKAQDLCQGLIKAKLPLFCVCLGHQILCHTLGFRLAKKSRPFQGAQEIIDLFGEPERVGFYNTFTGMMDDQARQGIEVSYDVPTGEIHALRGDGFLGLQFHPESILTTNGICIVHEVLKHLLLA